MRGRGLWEAGGLRNGSWFSRWALGALLAVCLFRLWLMPLGSSLWTDEIGTAFVVTHGAQDPSLAVAPQVPASVYYVLPRVSTRIFGESEIAYRLPSTLALGVALLLVGLLARRLVHRDAAWFAVFSCLALKGFDYEAADARPYALGTALACAALWGLVRWLDEMDLRVRRGPGGPAHWVYAGLFVVLAAVLWRVHLLYWPFYVVLAIYAAMRGWRRALPPFAAVALLLIPVAVEAWGLRKDAGLHVMTAMPGWRALVDSLKPGLVAVMAVGAVFWRRRKLESSSTVLILAWWLTVPLALFAFSRATGTSVFLERYLSLSLPGAALAATAAIALWLPENCWRAAALVVGLVALATLGRWSVAWPPHHPSDWRGAAAAVNRAVDAGTPVLSPSPFLEARPPKWHAGYSTETFLYSHLVAYPVRGAVVTLPFGVEPVALPASRFVLYGGGRNAAAWQDWIEAQTGRKGRALGNFGDVVAMLFEQR